MAFSQSTFTRPRPATSFAPHDREDEEDDEEEVGPGGKRKGMPPIYQHQFSSISSYQQGSTLQVAKLRPAKSLSTFEGDTNPFRDISISTAMSRLRVRDDDSIISTLASNIGPSTQLAKRQLRDQNSTQALVKFKAPDDNFAHKSPSQIPILKTEAMEIAIPVTPSKIPKLSPTKTPYLSKDSNNFLMEI